MTQVEFNLVASPSQNAIILDVLQRAGGRWVPMLVLEQASGSRRMNSRCADLRRRGHNIENKTEWVSGVCRSWYRLLQSHDQAKTIQESAGDVSGVDEVFASGTPVPGADRGVLELVGGYRLPDSQEALDGGRGEPEPIQGNNRNPAAVSEFPAGTPAVGLPTPNQGGKP